MEVLVLPAVRYRIRCVAGDASSGPYLYEPTEQRRRGASRASTTSRDSSMDRASVYDRLYGNAQVTARKLEERRRQR
jgi:hypothetical protein